jgi:hypothetical protein
MRVLQLYLSTAHQRDCQLKRLTCSRPPGGLLSLIASRLQRLHSLSLSVNTVSPRLDFSPLMTASGAAYLPHLTALRLSTSVEDDFAQRYRSNPEPEQLYTAASLPLLAAYSPS